MTQQKVTGVTVSNFKGIVGEAHIDTEGKSLIAISGANGAGKSSFIEAVEQIFVPGGIKATPKPINDGADSAFVEVATDLVIARRTYKRDKDGNEDAGTLTVTALDGAKYASGRDFIMKATGGALFDPFEFVKLPEKDQRAQLLARVELPFDLDELDRTRLGAFDGRTDVTREVKRLTALLGSLVQPAANTPEEEVSSAALLAELESATAKNNRRFAAQQGRTSVLARIAELEQQLATARTVLIEADEQLALLPPIIETESIRLRIDSADTTNAAIRDAKAWRAVKADLDEQTAKEAGLTKKLAEIDKRKADALAAAKFPVDGLGVNDEGITYRGLPFRQTNTAEKIAVAYDLATLGQPDLRLTIIKDGDALDDDTLARIAAISEARGYLTLVERDRGNSRDLGVTFVAGQVSA